MITIASFCTIVDYLLQAFLFDMSMALGPYIPLIIVNCIILSRAEMCASKSPVVRSAVDAVGMGLGFTVALTLIGSVREVLGTSSILGYPLPLGFTPWCVMILPSGAFLTFGILLGVINWLKSRKVQEA
jgi:electron transport complex protein RnfE